MCVSIVTATTSIIALCAAEYIHISMDYRTEFLTDAFSLVIS